VRFLLPGKLPEQEKDFYKKTAGTGENFCRFLP
jgi:hypothetical protein